jgi:nucleoside-diphosphate-sugar epimerase
MERLTKSANRPNILITGASGFLGKYAVEEFSECGYGVVANGRNIDALNALEGDNVQILPGSLSEIATAIAEVDSVVHVAALSSPWGSWKDFYEHNVVGTQQVVEFCVNNEVRRLVYVSSPSVYTGRGDRYNITESDFDEKNHLNNYIKSKIAAEKIVQASQAEGAIPEVVIVRPRGLLGIGDPSMIPRLLKANEKIGIPLFNGGSNLVDFTCVENVAMALRLAVESSQANTNVYNITNGEPRTFKSVLDDFFMAIDEKPRYRQVRQSAMYAAALALETAYSLAPGKPEPLLTRYVVCTLGYSQTLDISRAQQDLGYTPVISLDEGIRNYAADYRSSHA